MWAIALPLMLPATRRSAADTPRPPSTIGLDHPHLRRQPRQGVRLSRALVDRTRRRRTSLPGGAVPLPRILARVAVARRDHQVRSPAELTRGVLVAIGVASVCGRPIGWHRLRK